MPLVKPVGFPCGFSLLLGATMDYVDIPLYGRHRQVIGSAKVSPEDAETVSAYRWHIVRAPRVTPGYAESLIRDPRTGKRRHIRMHRLILGILDAGSPVEGDHINGDPLDNRRSNLRAVTQAQNSQNVRVYAKSKSGYRGVWFHTGNNRWQAQAKVAGRRHHLGYFDTKEQAAQVVHEWRLENMPFYVPDR